MSADVPQGSGDGRPRPPRPAREYKGPVIDCDVHQNWPSQEAFLPYMTKGWQEYVLGPGRAGPIPMITLSGYHNPHGAFREDDFPKSGGAPGSDYETMKDQLLDPFNVHKAVLTHGDVLFGAPGLRNPYFAAEVMRAANDWTRHEWLDKDDRLAGSILINNQLPDVAAEEVRRVARDPRMIQVILGGNALSMPLGHPLYHPIYAAAAEVGLPIALHVGNGGGMNPSQAGGGSINFYMEHHTLAYHPVMTNLVSFITHGVFEKFPTLKLALVEAGVAWVPAMLWRLDANYKGLRRETPWVKRLPSEYVRDHVRWTTQPLEASPKREQLIELLSFFGGEDMLMFATDYPHWDADEVGYVASRLPTSWHRKIYYDNAMKFYGFADVPADKSRAGAVVESSS